MKKSIITLGILCAMFAGCKQKPNEPDKEKFEAVLMEWEQQQSQENEPDKEKFESVLEAWEQKQSQENQVITTIMERRSIRKYKPQAVERDKMDIILRCGINAPNGQNKQSWEVRVVDNPQLLDEMREAIAKGHPDLNPEMVKGCFRDAPTMVFIARDPAYDFSAYDCGLLAENMVLSAWSMGIGSICLGSPVRFLTDNDVCKPLVEKLGFSEGYELSLCVGFGYPDEAPVAKPRDWNKVQYVD